MEQVVLDIPTSSATDTRPPAFFIADHVALDFANTFSTPSGTPTDWLRDGRDVLAWMATSDLVTQVTVDEIRNGALPAQLDVVAAQARALRDWFRGFVIDHKGKPLRASVAESLGPLNKLLARDDEYWQVEVAGAPGRSRTSKRPSLRLVARRGWRSPDDLLFPLARSMADLICETDFRNVRMCEGKDCTLLFVDKTRAKGRRWCSMALCGNRAKQAAHRARLRDG